jgi:hypothetical protein
MSLRSVRVHGIDVSCQSTSTIFYFLRKTTSLVVNIVRMSTVTTNELDYLSNERIKYWSLSFEHEHNCWHMYAFFQRSSSSVFQINSAIDETTIECINIVIIRLVISIERTCHWYLRWFSFVRLNSVELDATCFSHVNNRHIHVLFVSVYFQCMCLD